LEESNGKGKGKGKGKGRDRGMGDGKGRDKDKDKDRSKANEHQSEPTGEKAVAQVLRMVKALAGEDEGKYAGLNLVVQGCVDDIKKAAVAERPTHTQLKDIDHRIKNKKEQIQRLAGLEEKAQEALELAEVAVQKSKDDSITAKSQLEKLELDRNHLLAQEVVEQPVQGQGKLMQIIPEDLAAADDSVRSALQARLDTINTALGPMQKAMQEQMDLAKSLIAEAREAAKPATPAASHTVGQPMAASTAGSPAVGGGMAGDNKDTKETFEEMDLDDLDEDLKKDILECQSRARKQKGEEWTLVGGKRRKSG